MVVLPHLSARLGTIPMMRPRKWRKVSREFEGEKKQLSMEA